MWLTLNNSVVFEDSTRLKCANLASFHKFGANSPVIDFGKLNISHGAQH